MNRNETADFTSENKFNELHVKFYRRLSSYPSLSLSRTIRFNFPSLLF